MKKNIVFSITASFFLLLLTTVLVSAVVVRLPGVQAADWFLYNVGVYFSSNDPNATIPYGFSELNQTQWIRLDVTKLNYTIVYYEETMHFKNASEDAYNNTVDVAGGYSSGPFVAANLNAGDALYPSGYYSNWIINDTVTTMYLSGPRQTNRVNITQILNNSTGVLVSQSQNQSYDRETGAPVQMAMGQFNQTGSYTTEFSVQVAIIGTNRWSIVPEYPSFTILPLFMVATLLAVAVYRRKHTEQTS
jgi:hypothetical protein